MELRIVPLHLMQQLILVAVVEQELYVRLAVLEVQELL
jgi:hypothetical protein